MVDTRRTRRPSKAASKAAATRKRMGHHKQKTAEKVQQVLEKSNTPPRRASKKRTASVELSPALNKANRSNSTGKSVRIAMTPSLTLQLRGLQESHDRTPSMPYSDDGIEELFPHIERAAGVLATVQAMVPSPPPASSPPPVLPVYPVYCRYRMSTRSRKLPTPPIEEMSSTTFSLERVEEKLQPVFDKEIGKGTLINSQITCQIKLRGTYSRDEQVLEDFGFAAEEELLSRVRALYQMAKKPKQAAIDLFFEWKFTYKAEEKVLEDEAVIISSDAQGYDEKIPRPSRTTKLLESYKAHQKAAQQIKDTAKISTDGIMLTQLRTRWQCISPECNNINGHCFEQGIAPTNAHYVLSGSDMISWANAVVKGNASIEQPPDNIWALLRAKGPYTNGAKNPALQTRRQAHREELEGVQNGIKSLTDIMTQQMQMSLMRDISRQQAEQRREDERRRREDEVEEQQYRQIRASRINNIPDDGNGIQSRHQLASYIENGIKMVPSSPLHASDDDSNVLTDFFGWKCNFITNGDVLERWRLVERYIIDRDYSQKMLQELSDVKHHRHKAAVEEGLSAGILERISSEFARYKVQMKENR